MTDMAQKILLWRESLSVMPDHHFFEIIRMYLGEIKTPYNKQRLIEDLSVFLRRDDNRLMITKLLSKSDLELVTAKDLVAQVDMGQIDYKLGQVTVPVEIILNDNETCWAYGTHYTVRATIKAKS